MWVEECDGFAELCRGYLPYYLLIVLPIFIIISPANPVAAAHDFPVYRMHQYDLHGVPHGCRSTSVSLEARSVAGWSTSRHCIIVGAFDLSLDAFHSVKSKAGALIIILPKDMKSLSKEEQQHILMLEETMIYGSETTIPVYFTHWNTNLQAILDDLTHSSRANEKSASAMEATINSISASGYQVVIAAGPAVAKMDAKVATLYGRLNGLGANEKIPTLALVAHYDSAGAAPELSFGAESNASGVAMLLELARIFSTLYSNNRSTPRYNLVFVLTGAGKLNYQGSKKWLEDQLDGIDGSIIQDASYVICLDSVSATDNLYVHVSKPPKENSSGGLFYKNLKAAAESIHSVKVEGIHKKINLADESLAWEHERYSIRRLPAATLSALRSHDDVGRASILDVTKPGQIDQLHKHTQIVAEALAQQMYNLSSSHVFGNAEAISKDSLSMWLSYLTSQPRSASLLVEKHDSLVNSLQEAMSRYLGDVKVAYHSSDKRDPEFVFYDVTKATMNVYSVKPAVFDLFLTIAIIAYLGVVYLAIHEFPRVYTLATRLSAKAKSS